MFLRIIVKRVAKYYSLQGNDFSKLLQAELFVPN